jgi:hypothetical protein
MVCLLYHSTIRSDPSSHALFADDARRLTVLGAPPSAVAYIFVLLLHIAAMPPLNNLDPEGGRTWHSDPDVLAMLEFICNNIPRSIDCIMHAEELSEGRDAFEASLREAVDDFIVHRDRLERLRISQDCFSASVPLHSSLQPYAIDRPSSKTGPWNIDDAREQFRRREEAWEAKDTDASRKTIIKVTRKDSYVYLIHSKSFDGSAKWTIGGQYVSRRGTKGTT